MAKRKKRAYESPVRRQQVEETRRSIVDAAATLLKGKRPHELSFADVAARSGVGVRTIYRYFATSKDLAAAVAAAALSELADVDALPDDLSDTHEHLGQIHRRLSGEPSLYHLFFELPLRSGIGLAKTIERWTADKRQTMSSEAQQPALAAFELFMSPYAWEVMHSHHQLPPETITRLCMLGMQAVMDELTRHPEWLESDGPLPPMFRPRHERKRKKPTSRRTRK